MTSLTVVVDDLYVQIDTWTKDVDSLSVRSETRHFQYLVFFHNIVVFDFNIKFLVQNVLPKGKYGTFGSEVRWLHSGIIVRIAS